MMAYREIIRQNILQADAKRKKSTTEREKKYWIFIINELQSDLIDYETNGFERWQNPLALSYRPRNYLTADEFWKRFFGGFRF